MSLTERKRPPAQAFMGSGEGRVIAAINSMAHRMFLHARRPFNAAQLMYLFLEPQYHGPMQIAYAENHGGSLTQSLYISIRPFAPDDVEASGFINFEWRHEDTPDGFFPRYTQGGSTNHPVTKFADGAYQQPGLIDHFIDVAQQVVRVSYEWGLIRRVFLELNQPGYCTTPPQMRFVWPSILPILKAIKNEKDDELARSMQHESIRAGDKARVPLAVQPMLRESYQAVTRSIVILDHPVEDKLKSIRYNMLTPKFKKLGLEFDGATAMN